MRGDCMRSIRNSLYYVAIFLNLKSFKNLKVLSIVLKKKKYINNCLMCETLRKALGKEWSKVLYCAVLSLSSKEIMEINLFLNYFLLICVFFVCVWFYIVIDVKVGSKSLFPFSLYLKFKNNLIFHCIVIKV